MSEYRTYWGRVLGEYMSPRDVVDTFYLVPADLHAVADWLAFAEREAWRSMGQSLPLPASWQAHHDRALEELGSVTLRCIDSRDGSPCRGAVAWHWPGAGAKRYPRCEHHGRAREREQWDASARYGAVSAPADFDSADAGERWA